MKNVNTFDDNLDALDAVLPDHLEMHAPLCPACARREQQPHSGLCAVCYSEHLQAEYVERGRAEIDERRTRWGNQTMVLRSARRRQMRRLRPRTPAPDNVDPFALAGDAIKRITLAKAGLSPAQRQVLDDAAELVRQLAWGPEESA